MPAPPLAVRVPDAGAGMVIPPHLVGVFAVLVETGLGTWDRTNGGLPARWDVGGLHRILDAAKASAGGWPPVTLEPQARTPYTTSQAAAVMGISERRVRHHAATGRIRATKKHRDWEIDRQAAEDYRQPGRTR